MGAAEADLASAAAACSGAAGAAGALAAAGDLATGVGAGAVASGAVAAGAVADIEQQDSYRGLYPTASCVRPRAVHIILLPAHVRWCCR